MKTYYVCAGVIFILIYTIFHFGFRKSGAEQLYRINENLAFEVEPETDNYNGLTVHGYQRASNFVCFICGEYERDDSEISIVNVKYRLGDWVYSDYPQHETAKTDIVNLRTGETIAANVPADFKFGDDLSKLAEYNTHGLVKADEFKLTQEYVKANFQPLSSYTSRCVYAHIIFAIFALFMAFPKLIFWVMEATIQSADPFDPSNIYGGN